MSRDTKNAGYAVILSMMITAFTATGATVLHDFDG